MDYLVKDEKLEIKYERGKGAWAYHIEIPNTKHIRGRFSELKVSGYIDVYKVDLLNLLSISGRDKLVCVNQKIRKTLNKDVGDLCNVTLSIVRPHIYDNTCYSLA